MDYLDELDDSAIQALAEMGVTLTPTTFEGTPVIKDDVPPRRRLARPKVEPVYLLRLEPPLSTSREVANNLKLPRVPRTETGDGINGPAYFCRLQQSELKALDDWTAENYAKKKWTKIRLAMAHKDLPLCFLGHDLTLPQHRPNQQLGSAEMTESAMFEAFPVVYFFYGMLACTARLSELFEVHGSDVPELKPATLFDGRIRMWANKYRALVDCPAGKVEGHACVIASKEEEDALRRYEGDNYEVVAARFVVGATEVVDRAFRFVGCEDELL